MNYFDSVAGEARLAVMKYQASVPQKKGTLFVNPGKISAGDYMIPYVDALQVGLGALVLSLLHPLDIR